jgi:hypothetical protein
LCVFLVIRLVYLNIKSATVFVILYNIINSSAAGFSLSLFPFFGNHKFNIITTYASKIRMSDSVGAVHIICLS